jgi:hypothetical protein
MVGSSSDRQLLSLTHLRRGKSSHLEAEKCEENLNFCFLLLILLDRSVAAQVGSIYVLRSFAKVTKH